MWFQEMMGFTERNPNNVREKLSYDGTTITSKINGHQVKPGKLMVVSLTKLREYLVTNTLPESKPNKLSELVGDVQSIHADVNNAGAIFQVASQFNLLEMPSPDITPEMGIDRYNPDYTQGPASAIACGGGTIFRNYFVEINGFFGQTKDNQIDCLAKIGRYFNNGEHKYWTMYNGYMLPTNHGLSQIETKLKLINRSPEEINNLMGELSVGIQSETQVTLPGCKHSVSQVYCSALPIKYTGIPVHKWCNFATLILNACYEATLCAAIENKARTGSNKLFLTLVGGGAFGNDERIIVNAIEMALLKYENRGLDIKIVSYRHSNPILSSLLAKFSK